MSRLGPRATLALSFALFALVQGCGGVFDLAWLLTGPETHLDDQGPEQPVSGSETRWRELALDREHGLLCVDRAGAQTYWPTAQAELESPDGFLELMDAAVIIDAVVLGMTIGIVEGTCLDQPNSCTPRENVYPWFTPIAVDLVWSLVRALTIHPTIFHAMRSDVGAVGTASESFLSAEPCPTGTVVSLGAGAQRLEVRIDVEGALWLPDWGRLAEFLAVVEAGELRVEGALGDVRLDASAAAEIVLEAQRRAEQARAQAAAAVTVTAPPIPEPPVLVIPAPPPPPNGTVIIEVRP